MTTKHYNRPTAAYSGEAGLTNTTKYYTDSTSSPKVPISSTKVDGDINYLIDAVNELYDTAVSGSLPDGAVTNAKMADRGACSVIGRSANSTGAPADISAATNDVVLVRKSNSLSFGTVPTAGIDDAAITAVKIADTNVTFAKIQNVNTNVLIGRGTSGTGSVEQLTAGSGLTLSAGAITLANATDSAIGGVELATAAETLAGTDSTRALTSSGFAGNASLTANGYYKMPGGLILQWGSGTLGATTNNSTASVSFPTAFATACFCAVAGMADDGSTAGCQTLDTSFNTTGMTLRVGNTTNAGNNSGYYWFAIGV